MADAPWRCSQCGTVNEPVANACRTCGRWPSLFDLQESVVEDVELEDFRRELLQDPRIEVEQLEPETFQTETYEPDVAAPEPPGSTRRKWLDVEAMLEPKPEPGHEQKGEATPEGSRRRQVLSSIIVPLGVVIYLLIMLLTNR